MRKFTLFFVILFAVFNSLAAQVRIEYFDNHWVLTNKEHASYYRKSTQINDTLFQTDYYYMFDKLVRKGYRTSLENECYVYRTSHYIFYDSTGYKEREGDYLHGRRTGTWRYYYKGSDALKRVEQYVRDTIIGPTLFYDRETQHVTRKLEYKDGNQVRAWKYVNGDTSYTETKTKKKISETTEYGKDGRVRKLTRNDESGKEPPACYDSSGVEIPCDTGQGQKFTYSEQMPVAGFDYNGYLDSNVIYPLKARKSNVHGRVIVKFTIDEDGTVTNVNVAKGIGSGCDEEAARVIAEMPAWTSAGVQNGERVRVFFSLPIIFKLE